MENTIDRLTAYLPRLESEQVVDEFFRLVEHEFHDYDYAKRNDINSLEAKLYDDEHIAQASIDQCKTLMTFILRGDKFCGDYWYKAVRDGRVQAIVLRLVKLTKEG